MEDGNPQDQAKTGWGRIMRREESVGVDRQKNMRNGKKKKKKTTHEALQRFFSSSKTSFISPPEDPWWSHSEVSFIAISKASCIEGF